MPGYKLTRPIVNGKRASVWYVSWSEDGRSYRKSTGETDKGLAEQWLASFTAAMDLPPRGAPVSQICDAYLADRIEDGIRDPATVENRLNNIKSILGAYSPDDLTRPQVRLYHIARRKGGVSDGTINAECRALRAALNWAFKMRWIDKAPFIEAPKEGPPRDRFLSWDEFTALLDASAPHLRTFLALALFTGQRKAAILELTWDCIDWERAGIWFPQTQSRKSRTPFVSINAPLALSLGTAALTAQGPYIVHWNGERVGNVKKAFHAAARRAGVEDVQIHDMRRTAATWLVHNGGSIQEAAFLLDDNVDTVARHYLKFSNEYSKQVTGRIAG